MKIQMTGRHLEITPAIKQFVEDKLSALNKFSQNILSLHVIMEAQNKEVHSCEITLEGKHNLHLSAHAETKNLYESIKKAMDKLVHQLRDQKHTFADKRHRVSTKSFENQVLENELASEGEEVYS